MSKKSGIRDEFRGQPSITPIKNNDVRLKAICKPSDFHNGTIIFKWQHNFLKNILMGEKTEALKNEDRVKFLMN